MKSLIGSVLVGLCASTASAQTDVLYTIGNDGWNNPGTGKMVQGGSVVGSFNTQTNGDSALAVTSTIKTMGRYYDGKEYDLGGTYLGTTYPNVSLNLYDGGTDGSKYNYAVQYTGQLYRFDLNWGNPTLLAVTNGNDLGLTVDQSTGHIWTHGFDAQLREYDTAGTLLNTYFSPNGSLASLAWEPSSDTFWIGGASGELMNISKTGQYITSVFPQGYFGGSGLEFAVPAPGAAALLGIGGLVAARRRRA